MEIIKGQRNPINNFFDETNEIIVEVDLKGPSVYDVSCFGVDCNDKLSDERYMIFYNQTESPNGEIKYETVGTKTLFRINLSRLPASVNKLVFTASIDGNGTMAQLLQSRFLLRQANREDVFMNVTGIDFQQEKAIILIEIYNKTIWRFSAIAAGFNGGLDALLEAYGGEEASSENPGSQSVTQSMPQYNNNVAATPKVSLEKRISEKAPELISLVKPLKVSLEKNNLTSLTARVALVVDASGSMTAGYRDGIVQMIINKVLPVAIQFDDDEELDFWFYGSKPKEMPAVTLDNYKDIVPKDYLQLIRSLGGGNNEPPVMREIIDRYKDSKLPVYVIFITDGGISKTKQISQLMIESSNHPIFWQFVGVNGYAYGILKKLDDMQGRKVDNADFFALDDFKKVPDAELYERLLNEFPGWLKEAALHNII